MIPAWPHYAAAFLLAVTGEFLALALAILFLTRIWWGIAVGVAIGTAIELARSAWLRGKSQVRWINRESMQRQAAGAWVPK